MAVTLLSNALILETELNELKEQLDILLTDTSYDDKLKRWINRASMIIEGYCKRKLVNQTYTTYLDGNGTRRLLLPQWPAVKPTAIYIESDGVFTGATALETATYEMESESIVVYLGGKTWPRGTRNIKLEYSAGYIDGSEPREALKYACLELIDFMEGRQKDRRIGMTNKGKGGETTSFENGLPEYIEFMLDPYVRVEIFAPTTPVRNY